MLNLDTHILVDALEGELRPAERRLLSNDRWGISAIVLWELAKLAQLRRIGLDLGEPRLRRVLRQVHTWPLCLDVCRTSCELDFRGDPADELIAATSIVHQIPLVTRDRRIHASRLVPLAKLR
jgi:PIN domain nuclease of toxin-antitoxin system